MSNNEYTFDISNAEFPTFSQTNEGHPSYRRMSYVSAFSSIDKIQLSQSLALVLLRNSERLCKYIYVLTNRTYLLLWNLT